MLIGSGDLGLGLSAKIIEPKINRDASDYIVEHYTDLVQLTKKFGIKEEKANDLVHDVYLSVVESEDNGNGFDMEYGNKLKGDLNDYTNMMTVEQFVFGRIKRYAKNNKYNTNFTETSSGHLYKTEVYYETVLDEHGNAVLGKNGQAKTIKRVHNTKKAVTLTTMAASFNSGDSAENNDEFQVAFATASSADSSENITELYSLQEQVEYCIDVCELHGVKILNLFKNMDLLASMLDSLTKRKSNYEKVFKQITNITENNDEFADALISVLHCSEMNRPAFNLLMSAY